MKNINPFFYNNRVIFYLNFSSMSHLFGFRVYLLQPLQVGIHTHAHTHTHQSPNGLAFKSASPTVYSAAAQQSQTAVHYK